MRLEGKGGEDRKTRWSEVPMGQGEGVGPQWARRLRERRRAACWTQKELVRRLVAAADERTRARLPGRESMIREIRYHESGRHRPGPIYTELYCRVYGTTEDELFGFVRDPVPAVALPSLAPDPDLYERLTRAVREPRRVDEATVRWLERCLAEHRRVEDTTGSRPLLPVVRAQLAAVAELAHGAGGALGERLVGLAAEYAQFVAWMCQDSGNLAAGLAWYDRAHAWALEAGDARLAATTLSMRAHQAWSIGDGPACVRLAEAARLHDGRTTPGVQGMAAQMAARGHALMGEADAARALLDEAERLIARATERPEDEPAWMYFYDAGWFAMQRGMAEIELGAGDRAVPLLEAGLSRLPEAFRRDRAWFGSCLAKAYLLKGDADAAAGTALRYAGDAVAVNAYAVRTLRDVASALRDTRLPAVRDLDDLLTAARDAGNGDRPSA